jgi:hypothetical protein
VFPRLPAAAEDYLLAGQYSSLTAYGLLIGRNAGTPVSHTYEPPFRFTGQLDKVTIEIEEAAIEQPMH